MIRLFTFLLDLMPSRYRRNKAWHMRVNAPRSTWPKVHKPLDSQGIFKRVMGR